MNILNTPDDPRHAVADPMQASPFYRFTPWLLLGAAVAYVAVQYGSLPAEVPMHWNGAGEITRRGAKVTVWLLPGIAALTIYLLGLAARTPFDLFNYPVKVTAENAAAQHRITLEMLASMRIVIALLFGAISYFVVASAVSGENRFHEGIFWVLLAGLFGVIGLGIWRAYQSR